MNLQRQIVKQFRFPAGVAGRIAGLVMANRPSNRARNSWTVDLLGLAADSRVLEIGYGPGLALKQVLRTVTESDVTGIDHSAIMREQATARNREAVQAGRLSLLIGSAEDALVLEPGFDIIYSVNVAMFWSEPQSVFEKLHTLLAPGGLVATTHQPRHRNANPGDAAAMAEKVRGWMSAVGYVDLRTEELDLRPIPAVCVLEGAPVGDPRR